MRLPTLCRSHPTQPMRMDPFSLPFPNVHHLSFFPTTEHVFYAPGEGHRATVLKYLPWPWPWKWWTQAARSTQTVPLPWPLSKDRPPGSLWLTPFTTFGSRWLRSIWSSNMCGATKALWAMKLLIRWPKKHAVPYPNPLPKFDRARGTFASMGNCRQPHTRHGSGSSPPNMPTRTFTVGLGVP